ncbi:MAG TPA: histidine kinase, partial [Vicinamibacterales bacterium]|nr:histidine kinase [Vicinamibacterales bacterium]
RDHELTAMHPVLAPKGRLALYLGSWLFVGGLLAGLFVAQRELGWIGSLVVALPLSTVYAFVCLSAWYVARSMPLSSTTGLRVLATALAAAVVSGTLWLGATRVWVEQLTSRGWVSAPVRASGLDTIVLGFGVLLYLLSLAVSYLIGTFDAARQAERRALEVQVLAREAELRSLRAQVDPHFIFNSLHSISALTSADPAAARRMTLLLAEFLRESLALGGADRIPVERELRLAERFLEIERVRFGSRLEAAISPGNAAGCFVPPLLLQPIVENAITHGVAQVLEGGTVEVSAARSDATLSIVVENPCDPQRPRGTGAGVGLSNVRARLRAAYGGEARLQAAEKEGRWRVELTLPLDKGQGTRNKG